MLQLSPPPETVQDRAVYDYLYQLQEYLRVAQNTPVASSGGAPVVVSSGQETYQEVDIPQEMENQFQSLKAIIIKTADDVTVNTKTEMDSTLKNYVAKSDFGEYQETINQQFDVSAEGSVAQKISHVEAAVSNTDTTFGAYVQETKGYIRSGIVDYDGGNPISNPIIGIAVGQDLKSTRTWTVGEKTYDIIEKSGFRAIYGAKELSFWQDGVKVAYMSDQKLFIKAVTATEALEVGKWLVTGAPGGGLTVQWAGDAV